MAQLPAELMHNLADPLATVSGEPTKSDPNLIQVTVVKVTVLTALDEADRRGAAKRRRALVRPDTIGVIVIP